MASSAKDKAGQWLRRVREKLWRCDVGEELGGSEEKTS